MTTTALGVWPRWMPRCRAASIAAASSGGVTAVGAAVGFGDNVAVGAAVGTATGGAVGGPGGAVCTTGGTGGTTVDVGAAGAGDWQPASNAMDPPATIRSACRLVRPVWLCVLVLIVGCAPAT